MRGHGNVVVAADSSGRVRYVNRSFTTLTGWTSKEVLGKKLEELGYLQKSRGGKIAFTRKLTGSINSNHRFEGAYAKEALTQANNTFSTASSMDAASLYTRETPLDLYTLNYSGIITPQFFVEARASSRHYSFIGSGSAFTDRINGTLLLDRARGGRYWSPTFCGVCDPEKRDNSKAAGVSSWRRTSRLDTGWAARVRCPSSCSRGSRRRSSAKSARPSPMSS
jgi:hypothetical protein